MEKLQTKLLGDSYVIGFLIHFILIQLQTVYTILENPPFSIQNVGELHLF